MKASDLFVKALANEGVKYVFGVPGEENLDVLESLRTSSIKLVVTRHEQAAGFMAATYGRLTGTAGVALSTLGPGATNFITAAAFANLGGMPALFITGQKPIKHSKQGSFQIIDTVEVMRPVTKLAHQIVNADRIPAMVREAFRQAEEERPGSVHLELPEDIAQEESAGQLFERTRVRRPVAEEKALNKAIEMIEQAKHPLILVGAGANRKRVSKMLTKLINQTGMPFFNTQMGKGVVDERHERFIGTAALSENDYLHCLVDQADLIINVGHDVIEKPPFLMKRNRAQVIHINFYSAQVDDVYFPQHEVVGDIANALWQLSERVAQQTHWDFSYFTQIKAKLTDHISQSSQRDTFPILPQYLVATMRSAMPDDGIVALDNGMYKIWFARNYLAYQSNTLLLDNALATMGAGLPSAMAAKLVNPQVSVVAVVGDGGFMMNSQELETATRLKLDLTVIVLRDDSYGMIKWKQSGMGLQNFGLDFSNPDFVKYAESYGAHGHRVKKASDLPKLLEKSIKGRGVHVIEVPIDYSENNKVLNEELSKKTC